jgi:hypothetical protein
MVRVHAITQPGVDWTSLKEPCGAHPRECLVSLFICLFVYQISDVVEGTLRGLSAVVPFRKRQWGQVMGFKRSPFSLAPLL